MTTSAGRKTVSYLVKCALAANDSLVKADQNGNNYTFAGGIGLCPAWKSGDVHANAAVHGGDLRLHDGPRQHRRRPRPALARLERRRHRLGHRSRQLPDAGRDLLRRHHRHRPARQHRQANVNGPAAYYCDGAGFPAGAARRRRRPPRRQPERRALQEPLRQRSLPEPQRTTVAPSTPGTSARASPAAAPRAPTPTPSQGCPDGYQALQYPYGTERGAPGTTASPCGGTTTTRRCSTPATSTCCRPTSPRQPDGHRRGHLAHPAVEPVGRPRHLGLQHGAERQQLDHLADEQLRPSASTRAPAPTAPASSSPPATAPLRRTGTSPPSRRTAASTSPPPAPAAA